MTNYNCEAGPTSREDIDRREMTITEAERKVEWLVELLKERDTYKKQRDLLFPLLGACKRAMDKAQQDRGDEAADILRTAITKMDKNLWEEKK